MKTILFIIATFLFQINTINSFSQNTMLLTSGKKITIGEYKVSESSFLAYKNQKEKLKSIVIEDVFSIIDKSGAETIFYKSDTTNNESFSVDQMRFFVNGENDAINNYKSPWTTVGGIVIGAGSVISVPLAGLNSLYTPIFPTAYVSSVGLIKVKTKKLGIKNQYLENKHYVLGFEKAAKQKRIKNSLFGSGIGIAVGIGAALVFLK